MGRRHKLFIRLVRAMQRLHGAKRVALVNAWHDWARRQDWRTY